MRRFVSASHAGSGPRHPVRLAIRPSTSRARTGRDLQGNGREAAHDWFALLVRKHFPEVEPLRVPGANPLDPAADLGAPGFIHVPVHRAPGLPVA